jgi:hypothetical protein
MATQQEPQERSAAADVPQPAPTLEPEAIVEALRSMRGQIGEVTPLTARERDLLRRRGKTSNPVLQASINVIGAHDRISQAIAQPAEGVRRMYDEANRWTAVEDELRALLQGIIGANLVRRERIALIAAQAYNIGRELVRDPANAVLLPHVQEVRRLKRSSRRKKAGDGTQPPPAPETPPAPAP